MSSNLDQDVQQLCRAISAEKDPDKMTLLVAQLNRLLDANQAADGSPTSLKSPVVPIAEAVPIETENASETDQSDRKSA
jgi:hypothetical protein